MAIRNCKLQSRTDKPTFSTLRISKLSYPYRNLIERSILDCVIRVQRDNGKMSILGVDWTLDRRHSQQMWLWMQQMQVFMRSLRLLLALLMLLHSLNMFGSISQRSLSLSPSSSSPFDLPPLGESLIRLKILGLDLMLKRRLAPFRDRIPVIVCI